jgi:hypothetical protein
MFSSLFKLQLCFITKNRCVPKSTSMYVRQTDRHNLNFDVGGIVIQLVGKYRF